MNIAFLSDIVNTHNVRMGKSRCRLRLSSEILNKLLVLCEFGTQNLNCHISVQKTALCLIYNCHSAFAYFFNQFIPSG